MATSGEAVSWAVVDTICGNPSVRYWHTFDQPCNFSGEVDVSTDSDGSAQWNCPYCGYLNESTCEALDIA